MIIVTDTNKKKGTKRELKEFNPTQLLSDFASSGFDASMFEGIDESKFKKAPNIVDFTINPEFLNATILPKQVEMGIKLFAEYCPDCSDLLFLDELYDQDMGTIKRNITLLEHGVCPVCSKNRFQFIQEGKLNDYNEFAGCLGQRCIPKDSFVYTNRGIISMNDVESGDIVSHGFVSKKIDSGKLKLRTLKTEIGWDFKGSMESHIVPVHENSKIVYKKMVDVGIGDTLIMVSPSLFPPMNNKIYNKHTQWPSTFDRATSAFFGLVCRKYRLEADKLIINSGHIEVVFDMFLELFNFLPKVENNEIVVENAEFIDWFKIMTGNKQIPDRILQATEDSTEFFIKNFLFDDWSEDGMMLNLDLSEISQVMELKLILLNLGQLTMEIDGYLRNISIDTDDQDLIQLMNTGYHPVRVTDIIDGEEVEMADIQVPNTNVYTADGFMHHNSGKSKFIGIVANYVLHRFLCMPNPIRQFNQSAGDILNISFAGLSEDKVEKNLWGPFVGFMESSPWFQAYHSFLDEKGRELKKPLYTKRKTFIEYFHKKVLVDFYGSNGTSMRGDTRIFASADEIAFMGSGAEAKGGTVMNADAIYTSLNNSLATMRMKRRQIFNEKNFDVPPILIANISSPSSSKDKIMKQVKAAKTNPLIYGVQVATWDANPDFTEESLLKEFASEDPAEFYRNFGAQPPIESNPFLSEVNPIDRIAIVPPTNLYEFLIDKDKDALGDNFIYGKLVINQTDTITSRLISFDLGSTKNAFGLSIFKLDSEGRIILESGLVIKPSKSCKIHLPWIYDRITVPLMENYNVKFVFFDKWQSLDQVTRIRDKGINAQVYSLKYSDMDDVRGIVKNRGVLIPKLSKPMAKFKEDWEANDEIEFSEVSATLGIQLLTVRDLGNRMVKPAHGDDDLFRSFALGVCALSNPRIIKEMQTKSESNNGVGGIGVVSSYGGSAGAVSSGGSSIGVFQSRRR